MGAIYLRSVVSVYVNISIPAKNSLSDNDWNAGEIIQKILKISYGSPISFPALFKLTDP